MWRLVTHDTVVGVRDGVRDGTDWQGNAHVKNVETSDKLVGPGAGTRYQVTLVIEEVREDVWVQMKKVEVMGEEMNIEVKYSSQNAVEGMMVRILWFGVSEREHQELDKRDKFRVTVGGMDIYNDRNGWMAEVEDLHDDQGEGMSWLTYVDSKDWDLRNGAFVVKLEIETMDFSDKDDSGVEDCRMSCRRNWVLEETFKHEMSTADFSLECEGEVIPCHGLVLRAASQAFRGMLEQPGGDRVALQCTAQAGRALVRFLYTGDIEDTLLVELLGLADMLLVEELRRRVEARMVGILARTNMVEFLLAGEAHHGARVRKEAMRFLRANLAWLKGRQGWKELFQENKDLIIEVLE